LSIGIIDYGVGNLRSIQKAFESLDIKVIISSDRKKLENCQKLILPGVGAFAHCKEKLFETFSDITPLISSRPTLGICVGMQLMFEYSLEYGKTEGLAIISGHVDKIITKSLPIPHTGWSPIDKVSNDIPLFRGLPEKPFFYFNHSFICKPSEISNVIGTSDYDENFASVIKKNNYYGIQCHPEKSGLIGLMLLKNFYDFC